ncbi:MAG: hypothetical protein DMG07_15910 [Acidobacteria bacterium]|nr:MAG: hypothetical protein DMG07_15910 [Acidobacteriota bacterium]
MPHIRKSAVILAQLALLGSLELRPISAKGNGAQKWIQPDELRSWLTYFASDELEGRAVFSEGLGLAAAYIAGQLKSWGVQPGGDNGSYFQRVRVLGVKSTNRSTVTVEANGQTRTFRDGEGIRLPPNVGAKRTFSADQVEFLGYGLNAPLVGHNDYAGRSLKGKVAVWLGPSGPKGFDASYRRLLSGRARYAIDVEKAIASLGVGGFGRGGRRQGPEGEAAAGGPPPAGAAPAAQPQPAAPGPAAGPGAGGQFGFGGPPIERADFTTAQRLDAPIPPAVSGLDAFFEFLFAGQEVGYAELKEKAAQQEPLPRFALRNVKITFNLDADYKVVRTQLTRNVVGVVPGRDPALRDTYVVFGAHYDHVGYSEGEVVDTPNGPRRAEPRGRVKDGALEDRIWNGADDDGSGSIAILGVAKAFALGPKPRRSLVFVWHTGEERGLWGSRFFADYPSVPLERTVAQINLDMVGRNRDDKLEEADTVYLVGSDRISTELHNVVIDSNDALPKPLRLDFELNDPTDLEGIYYRSDHYSYAAKGIPIVFLTTGLHPDYHANTDSPDRIEYEKMARIAQLTYEIGARLGNLDHAPERDNRGPRVGKGSSGKLGMR